MLTKISYSSAGFRLYFLISFLLRKDRNISCKLLSPKRAAVAGRMDIWTDKQTDGHTHTDGWMDGLKLSPGMEVCGEKFGQTFDSMQE